MHFAVIFKLVVLISSAHSDKNHCSCENSGVLKLDMATSGEKDTIVHFPKLNSFVHFVSDFAKHFRLTSVVFHLQELDFKGRGKIVMMKNRLILLSLFSENKLLLHQAMTTLPKSANLTCSVGIISDPDESQLWPMRDKTVYVLLSDFGIIRETTLQVPYQIWSGQCQGISNH